jgi:DNA-binding beta-propeller fold protein YncE
MSRRTAALGACFLAMFLSSHAWAGMRLSLAYEIRDGVGGVSGLDDVSSVAVSTPDGAFVYALSDGDATLSVFSRDLLTGALTLVQSEPSGLALPNLLAISPDGTHVYAFGKGEAGVFSRDAITGRVTFLAPIVLAGRTTGVAFSPNGEHLYVADEIYDAVLVFARDAGTGALTSIQAIQDGTGGAQLRRPTDLAISPDGSNVYVTTDGDDSLVVFTRSAATGELTLLEQHLDAAGNNGLQNPQTVVVSPDGAQVYVGGLDQGLGAYDRGPGGALTFAASDQFPRRVFDLAISDDGTLLVAQSPTGEPDSVLLLARDLGTGAITLVSSETLIDNRSVAISRDTRFVYSGTSNDQRRLAVFRIIDGTCGAPAAGCAEPTEPLKSAIVLKDGLDRDQMSWKWTKGTSLTLADFADPITQPADVRFCLYDATSTLLIDSVVPAIASCNGKPCWKQSSSGTTLKYRDSNAMPEGVKTFGAKAGAAGFSSLKLKVQGDGFLPPPTPLALPVTFQVRSATGACWQAVYSTAQTNVPGLLKAKSD